MKKKKNLFLLLVLSILTIIPTITAFASLKSNTIGLKRNFVETDGTKRYEITANLNGGQFPKNSIPNFTQKEDGTFTYSYQPIATAVKIPTPTKDGMNFKGWTINSDTNNILNEYSIPAWNKENIKLTANWTPINSILVNGTTFNNKIKSISGYTKIEFNKESDNAATKNGIDVSQAQDKSTIAYLEGDTLKITSFGNIYANPDASNMFIELSNVTDITFNNFNTSKTTNMDSMFKTCTKLKSIDLTKLDTSNVTNMHDTFCGCSSITNFNIEALDTSSLTSMHGTFYDCDGLTTLNLNSLDTSKVTNMSFLVAECNNLKSIQIDKLNVSNVTTLRHMFKFCNNLQNLKLPNFNFNKIKDTEQMFDKCYKLTGSITINGTATNAYREMFYLAANDPNAKFYVRYTDNASKTLAQNMVNTKTQDSHIYIQDTATLVNDTEFNNSRVFLFGDEIPQIKENIMISGSKFNQILKPMLYSPNGPEKIDIIFEKGNPDTIPSNAFNINDISENKDGSIKLYAIKDEKYNLKALSKIVTPFTSTEIHIISEKPILFNQDSSSMFDVSNISSNIQTIRFNNINTSKTTNMAYMFKGCDNINQLDLSNFDLSNVSDVREMFNGCSYLSSELTINNENIANYSNMFKDCSTNSTADFVVKYKNTTTKALARNMVNTKSSNSNVRLYGDTKSTLLNGTQFNKKIQSLPNINRMTTIQFLDYIPENINPDNIDVSLAQNNSIIAYVAGYTVIVASNDTIMANEDSSEMFKNLAINNIEFNNFNTSNVTNMYNMFYNCGSLKNINFTNFDTSKVRDMGCMFSYCGRLENLDLSSFDTSNVTNMYNMFNYCSVLTRINGIENFNTSKLINSTYMFNRCNALSGEITISNIDTTDFSGMFSNCSTNSNTLFKVNYANYDCQYIAQDMVNTKSSNSNVRLGVRKGYSLLNNEPKIVITENNNNGIQILN